MKREMVMWLIIAVLVVGALLLGTQKAETMAIDFTNAANQYVKFTDAEAAGATPRTITAWVDLDSNQSSLFAGCDTWVFSEDTVTAEKLTFAQLFSGVAGVWTTTNNALTTGKQLIGVSYDNASPDNNPIIYVNGVAVAITEMLTPTGTPTTTESDIYIGGGLVANSLDGRVMDVRIYNRILTPAEHLQLYNGRGRDNIKNGLVFCPFLKGAAGLQSFDGATLAAGNTLVDPCSGAVGVPAGNPVGVGETYLR